MGQEHAEQEVRSLADAWASAELRGDVAFLERTLTDDFIGIGPLGFMLTRPEWVARHRSRDLVYETLTLDEVKVRVYHETAILTCRQVQQGAYRGNSIKAQLRTTLVFVQQQGQWRLASLHLSTIGQAPPITQSQA